jgi:hypothetical protein
MSRKLKLVLAMASILFKSPNIASLRSAPNSAAIPRCPRETDARGMSSVRLRADCRPPGAVAAAVRLKKVF